MQLKRPDLRQCLPLAVLVLLLLGTLTSTNSAAEPTERRAAVRLLDDFDGDIQNPLGGVRNVFVKAPSVAKAKRVIGDAQGPHGLCAKLTARQDDAGFCGYWVQFFDRQATTRQYLDASDWYGLSFKVRGQVGGEDLLVKLSDAAWSAKEDSLPVGHISDFLPGGVTMQWREVVIPLSTIKRLDLTQLAGISFKCESPLEQTVFIDDIHLKRSAGSQLVSPTVLTTKTNSPIPPAKAMWVWTTEKLLQSSEECRQLFAICKRDNIRRLWMQLAYDRRVLESAGSLERCIIRRPQELRSFLKLAHQQGLEVEALDGYPEFALRELHDKPLALVDAIVEFNQQSEVAARFDGIHFDNEPYVILGWNDPQIREDILHDFLTLNVECQRRARAAGIRFGVDIPFWWQSKSQPDAEPSGVVTFRGIRKAASHHCIDLLDNVGIMNYRDAADGADGLLAHGRDLLRYSDNVPHSEIYLGVETFIETPSTTELVVGLPIAEYRAALRDRGQQFARLSRVHDFRLARFDDGERVHVGLALPPDLSPAARELADRTLVELARAFGRVSSPRTDAAVLEMLERRLSKESEWSGLQRADVRDSELDVTFLGFKSTQVMPSKVTFGDDSLTELREEVEFAERGFLQHRSYSGIAVHSWESYRLLK